MNLLRLDSRNISMSFSLQQKDKRKNNIFPSALPREAVKTPFSFQNHLDVVLGSVSLP